MSGGLVGRVEQLLELAGKATPRPWSADARHIFGQVPGGRPDGELIAEARTTSGIRDAVLHRENAALIVAAVNLVEPLARDWQRLTSELENHRRASAATIKRMGDALDKAHAEIRALAAVPGEPADEEGK